VLVATVSIRQKNSPIGFTGLGNAEPLFPWLPAPPAQSALRRTDLLRVIATQRPKAGYV
jgi:hypothetical protein